MLPVTHPNCRSKRLANPRALSSSNLTLTQRHALATFTIYGGALSCGAAIHACFQTTAIKALTLGLIAPGLGFLSWSGPSVAYSFALILFASTLALFGMALILWFATGNVLLAPAVWLGAAGIAGMIAPPTSDLSSAAAHAAFAAGAMGALISAGFVLSRRAQHPSRAQPTDRPRPFATPTEHYGGPELCDLQLTRLLLDRALQPVDSFNGFEWRDQFQTAAIRYQLNFMSYALSLVQMRHTPSFTGYLTEAHRRLLRKQEDHRIWRYWALESAWGYLRRTPDPMPRGNIMYSGFGAAQMAYARSAGALSREEAAISLKLPDGTLRHYPLDDVAALLLDQYRAARWGLLECEPHWIYPLCNLITATALKAVDAQTGTDRWREIAPGFRAALDRDFTAADGSFIPFRSSLTGFALPGAGGVVMQAFPCLFLASLYPDLAEHHWERLRAILANRPWSRAFWPIDVGNYRFSRASSLAASAAAASEMGDTATARDMLAYLADQCPATIVDGVMHRPRASLWAHALELIASTGAQGDFNSLITEQVRPGPRIDRADYPDVLVATARSEEGGLTATLYGERTTSTIGLAGLLPGREYRFEGQNSGICHADPDGRTTIEIAVQGQTSLIVTPVV